MPCILSIEYIKQFKNYSLYISYNYRCQNVEHKNTHFIIVYCIAIFMMVSVPNNLNIQFSTLMRLRRNSNPKNQECIVCIHTTIHKGANTQHYWPSTKPSSSSPPIAFICVYTLCCSSHQMFDVMCLLHFPFDTIIWYMHSSLRCDYGFNFNQCAYDHVARRYAADCLHWLDVYTKQAHLNGRLGWYRESDFIICLDWF